MPSGILMFNSRGGCFPESRCATNCLPKGEDALDEDLFLNAGDYRHDFIPIEEFGYEPDFDHEDDEELDDVVGLQLGQQQIEDSARVMIENPELMVEMYREHVAIEDGYSEQDLPSWQVEARKYFIDFMRSVFAAMIRIESPAKINHVFCNRLYSEPTKRFEKKMEDRTVLFHLTRFARQEQKQQMAHAVALPILRTLGRKDTIAWYTVD